MITIDATMLRTIAPRYSGAHGDRQTAIIAFLGGVIGETLNDHHIDTPLRAAHFLSQTCYESGGFSTMEEFADGSAYEGRADLGNIEPGDGVRFKGRGLMQLTGRANYAKYGRVMGRDFLTTPPVVAAPKTALSVACWYWSLHGLNALADADDIDGITRKINGGLNGLDGRNAFLITAKSMLGCTPNYPAGMTNGSDTFLRVGSRGPDVGSIQQRLTAWGMHVVVDGVFGENTRTCIAVFQARKGLTADGVVGPTTWGALLEKSV
jgi:putative chitinase